jgi:hypothetical protein
VPAKSSAMGTRVSPTHEISIGHRFLYPSSPGFVPGIHVDGRDKPGHDDK